MRSPQVALVFCACCYLVFRLCHLSTPHERDARKGSVRPFGLPLSDLLILCRSKIGFWLDWDFPGF
jgi:hypothetical protein